MLWEKAGARRNGLIGLHTELGNPTRSTGLSMLLYGEEKRVWQRKTMCAAEITSDGIAQSLSGHHVAFPANSAHHAAMQQSSDIKMPSVAREVGSTRTRRHVPRCSRSGWGHQAARRGTRQD